MSADSTVVAAQVLDRVAVLVRAGVPARRAWGAVAARDPDGLGAALFGEGPPGGGPFGGGVDDLAVAIARIGADRTGGGGGGADGGADGGAAAVWPAVGAVWRIAERTGAPVADTLDALAVAVRDVVATRRAVEVALAGPRTSGRIVLALPLVGVLFGLAQGPAALLVLLGSPFGWGLLAAAGGLVLAARRWTAALVARADIGGSLPGLLLDMWAVALSGGAAWTSARTTVEAAVAMLGADAGGERDGPRSGGSAVLHGVRAVPGAEERAAVEDVLALATSVGVPAGPLLRAAASDLRLARRTEGLAAAERLGVRLMLPLGVCLLPAFVLVGVVPVVVALLGSVTGALP